MTINTIAIQSPGDMGHEIGRILVDGGFKVVSALDGRSKRTRDLAKSSGIIDVGNLENLYNGVDLILSIMRPDEALNFISKMCDLANFHKARPLLVDLNAVAPSTALKAEQLSLKAGLDFLDGGIIGEPPRVPENRSPRLYVSGTRAKELMALNQSGLDFRDLGSKCGSASGIKMAYAALTKGLTAIAINSMVTAKLHNVQNEFLNELKFSQENLFGHLEKGLPSMCPKAYRWIGEMEEISKTHSELDLPKNLFEGAADIYRLVEKSPLGEEIVENRKLGTSAENVADVLADFLEK